MGEIWCDEKHLNAINTIPGKSMGRGTMYSKVGLLCQLVPSLEMNFVLRKLFNISPGKGSIWNADESMVYRYDHDEKTWTY